VTHNNLCERTSQDHFNIGVKVLLIHSLRLSGEYVDRADLLLPDFSHKVVHVLCDIVFINAPTEKKILTCQ
jgi:hypothetical protein